MSVVDPLLSEYLDISFQIDRHFPGFIDAYFGPPEFKLTSLEAELPSPASLRSRVQALSREVAASGFAETRKTYLSAQLRAIETICQKLAGEHIGYLDEVASCFDIEPAFTPETRFEEAIGNLDAQLPGDGSVGERMVAWRARQVVSTDIARRLVPQILAETRRRTAEFVSLPEGDEVEIAFVNDRPWSGYNWYLGENRSRVDLNTDLPFIAHDLVDLIAHEAYPGHHTEHAIKDQRLHQDQHFLEHSIQLINTPECVISEGIATVAESMIFPGTESLAWQAANLYPAAGLEPDFERAISVRAFGRMRRTVSTNAAILHHEHGLSEAETIAYIQRFALRTEKEAKQSFRFLADPLWRPYLFTYSVGRQLAEDWLAVSGAETKRDRFNRLLIEQLTPGMLAQDVRAAESRHPE